MRVHPESIPESGVPGNYGQVPDMEKTSLNVAESSGKMTEAEIQHTVGATHSQPEAFSAGLKHPTENPAVNTGNQMQRTGRQETPGYMQVRVSVREKLAAIRERRAREQNQARKPEPGMHRGREAVL